MTARGLIGRLGDDRAPRRAPAFRSGRYISHEDDDAVILRLLDIVLVMLVGMLGAVLLTAHGQQEWGLAALAVALGAAAAA